MSSQRSPSLFQSFNNAAEGVVHALRTQRNLWIHFTVAAAVLVAAVAFHVAKIELMVLLLAMSVVSLAVAVERLLAGAVGPRTAEPWPACRER